MFKLLSNDTIKKFIKPWLFQFDMSNLIEADLDRLVEGQYRRVSLGLKPSGLIHLGTAMTFLHGILVLEKNPEAVLDASVKDLDFDFQRGRDFVSFQRLEDSGKCHGLMKEHTAYEITELLSEMARYFGVESSRIGVSIFSDITENPTFQKYITFLFTTKEGKRLLKQTVSGGTAKATALLSPICDSCGHSSQFPPRVSADGTLNTMCYNERCDVRGYEVALTEPRRVNFFYLVDKVRDLIPDEHGVAADLHIFGGDYGLSWGRERITKAQRVFNLLAQLSDNPPSIYVGPSVVLGGVKIGKSKRNGFDIQTLREEYPDWLNRTYDLLKKHPNEGRLDLAVMSHYFS